MAKTHRASPAVSTANIRSESARILGAIACLSLSSNIILLSLLWPLVSSSFSQIQGQAGSVRQQPAHAQVPVERTHAERPARNFRGQADFVDQGAQQRRRNGHDVAQAVGEPGTRCFPVLD